MICHGDLVGGFAGECEFDKAVQVQKCKNGFGGRIACLRVERG